MKKKQETVTRENRQRDLATEVQIAFTLLAAPMLASSVATAGEHVASKRASTTSNHRSETPGCCRLTFRVGNKSDSMVIIPRLMSSCS